MITWNDLAAWLPTVLLVFLALCGVAAVAGVFVFARFWSATWREIRAYDRSLKAEIEERRKANERIALRRFR